MRESERDLVLRKLCEKVRYGGDVELRVKRVNTGSNIYNINVYYGYGFRGEKVLFYHVTKYRASNCMVILARYRVNVVNGRMSIFQDSNVVNESALPKSVLSAIIEFDNERVRRGITLY